MEFPLFSEFTALITSVRPTGVFVLNILTLLFFLFLVLYLLQKFIALYREYAERKWKIQREAEKVLDRARKESISIISEAEEEAGHILGSVGKIKTKAEKEVERSLQEFSMAEGAKLSEVSRDFNETYRDMLKELKDLLHAYTRESIIEFRKSLEREYPHFLEEMRVGVQAAQKTAEKEIEEYKEEMMKKVESSLPKIVSSVSREVIGRSLDMDDHADIVISVLEKAKKEHLFR